MEAVGGNEAHDCSRNSQGNASSFVGLLEEVSEGDHAELVSHRQNRQQVHQSPLRGGVEKA